MHKTCEQCQNEFPRNPKESWKQYEGRKFCSYECAAASRRGVTKPASEIKSKYRTVHRDGIVHLEHRWLMEQHLGRKLENWEQVHHINHNRFDNRIENLQVVTQEEHALIHSEIPREKPCTECGNMFTPHKSRRRTAMTCGPACYGKLRSKINKARYAA